MPLSNCPWCGRLYSALWFGEYACAHCFSIELGQLKEQAMVNLEMDGVTIGEDCSSSHYAQLILTEMELIRNQAQIEARQFPDLPW